MIPSTIPWEKIKRIALLGTDRTNLPNDIKELFSSLNVDMDQNEDQILLDGITRLGLAYRTSRKYPKVSATLTSKMIDPQDHPPVSVAQMLPEILHGKYRDVLSEYLNCLQLRGWAFPPEHLPSFLDTCTEDPVLWEEVADFIGPTAEWLIEMNKDWNRLRKVPKEKYWKSKFPADKLRYYKYKRSVDPAEANDLLLKEWSSFSAKFKESVLATIALEIRHEDYNFLHQLPKEKSKKVAIAKFKILAQEIDSNLSKKAIEFLKNSLTVKKKISITLPDLSDAQDIGLVAKHPDFSGGLRANYLAQIIFAIPLVELEKIFDKSPEEIIPLISKNEWGFSFLEAIIWRIKLEKNQRWIPAVFEYYMNTSELIDWNDTYVLDVFKILEEKTFIELINRATTRGHKIITEDSPLMELAVEYPKQWPNEATFTLFKLVKNWMTKNPKFWEGWFVWQMLNHVAFMVDPMQLGILQKAFQSDPIWALAEDEINKFLEIVSFRYRLYKSYP